MVLWFKDPDNEEVNLLQQNKKVGAKLESTVLQDSRQLFCLSNVHHLNIKLKIFNLSIQKFFFPKLYFTVTLL